MEAMGLVLDIHELHIFGYAIFTTVQCVLCHGRCPGRGA